MSAMKHPTYPLREEQALAYTAQPERGAAIKVAYGRRRDREFPGWRERYDAEMRVYFRVSSMFMAS